MRPTVLLVDPDPITRYPLSRGLSRDGFTVLPASDAAGTLRITATVDRTLDAIVVDMALPDRSGHTLVRRLREDGVALPLAVVCHQDRLDEEAEALELGADVFLIKPVSPVLLAAQLRALLRRPGGPGLEPAEGVIRIGQLLVDPSTRLASVPGRFVQLSRRECALLHALARCHPRVLTRAELLHLVWGDGGVTANTVEVYVGYLRRKLAGLGVGRQLHTVYGRGYQLRDD